MPQGRKEVPNIIFPLYAKCMVCKNGIHTHTHTLLDRETAREELIAAYRRQPGVWVYTDGSVQPDACGAAAVFADLHGPFGQTRLSRTLGPFQSSTDAEMAGLKLALDHLATRTDWHQAYIVSDSQAALLQLGRISWRRPRASIWEVHRRALALRRAGHQVALWWAPGHADIEGNEAADTEARIAASGTRLGTETFSVSRSMLDHHLRLWYRSQAQGPGARGGRLQMCHHERTTSSTRTCTGHGSCLRDSWLLG